MTGQPTRTFWLELTGTVAVGLRRYHLPDSDRYSCADGYHSALVYTGVRDAVWRDTAHGRVLDVPGTTGLDDPRWPTSCRCGYVFTPDDSWQDWQELLYRRVDTGHVLTIRGHDEDAVGAPTPAPAGAMWDAWWYPDSSAWRGPDGIALMVRLPDGHDWNVDGQADNCTRRGDRSHKCWVRHGDPRQANVTVDKNGQTCSAGAGSIQSDGFHGFLRDGMLRPC